MRTRPPALASFASLLAAFAFGTSLAFAQSIPKPVKATTSNAFDKGQIASLLAQLKVMTKIRFSPPRPRLRRRWGITSSVAFNHWQRIFCRR